MGPWPSAAGEIGKETTNMVGLGLKGTLTWEKRFSGRRYRFLNCEIQFATMSARAPSSNHYVTEHLRSVRNP